MAGQARRARRRLTRGTVAVALVLAVAGLLFAANARLARGQVARQPQDLRELAAVESDRLGKLTTEVDSLRAQVEQLTAAQDPSVGATNKDQTLLVEAVSGRIPVTGPGVTVQLSDAPANGPKPNGMRADDLVVHQQDMQAVINALWAGGAEAMALQDQRVISTSAFRCVGNVLSLGGRVYSPPYVIRAIGDPKKLRAALDASPQIQIFQQYVRAVGLGWAVTTQGTLGLPGYEGTTDLQYASVPSGVNVLQSTSPPTGAGATSTP